MIDFRYHLVSIVSIFLALAVGIVLGAGPLQGELGDTLSKEVAGLRQDKAELNQQLEQARGGAAAGDAYIAETNPTMLAGVLTDRRVALVVQPGADAAVAESTAATLRTSGAAVVSTTSVSEEWVSPDEDVATARDAAVTDAAADAGIDVSDSGSLAPRDVLLAGLLTVPAAEPAAALEPARAQQALDVLAAAGLVDIDTEGFEPADLVVVVSGRTTAGDSDAREAAAERWVDLAIAFDTRATGAALAAEEGAGGEGVSVLATLRNDRTATEGVSSVDNAGSALGQASVVNALRLQVAGEVGQYGLAAGADAPYAPLAGS